MQINDYCEHETLRDGSPVVVRAIMPDDRDALQAAIARLSGESAYFRFFYPKRELSARELDFFTNVDFENHVALGVGLVEESETLPIGIARYIVDGLSPKRAEIAFTVDDNFQGIGVGSLLLRHLVLIAQQRGIDEFVATVLPTNQKMLQVFEHAGLPLQKTVTPEVVEISLALAGNS